MNIQLETLLKRIIIKKENKASLRQNTSQHPLHYSLERGQNGEHTYLNINRGSYTVLKRF